MAYIHMLVQIKPDKMLSKVVQLFKGGTNRLLRKEFPELDVLLGFIGAVQCRHGKFDDLSEHIRLP